MLKILKYNDKNISIKINNKKYNLHAQWLYENSHNTLIRDPYTNQLLIEVAEISKNLFIKKANIKNNDLLIFFNDNSKHIFSQKQILNQLVKHNIKNEKKLWNKKTINPPKFNFKKFNQQMLLEILESVEKFGFCLIKNMPVKRNGINELTNHIGPIKNTNWGGIADVKSIKKAYDLTMTTRALENHTDNPYRFPTQGYIFLHCLENSKLGGANTISDGFYIAEYLKKNFKNYFNTLTTFHTFFEYQDENTCLQNNCTLIELDNDKCVNQVRYNNRTEIMPFKNQKELDKYIEARRKFWSLIKAKTNNLEIKQQSGDMLILDNYRVLHGRTGYKDSQNKRYFRQGYMDRDILQSKLKTLRANS